MKRKVTVSKMRELIDSSITKQESKVASLVGDNPQIVKMRIEAQARLEAFKDVQGALCGNFYLLEF